MKEIVKYENRLNRIALTGFSSVELDLFMLLCAKTKNKQQELLTFDYRDLKERLGMSRQSDKYFHGQLRKMVGKLKKINAGFSNEKEFVEFNLFSTFRGNLETKTLTVRVNEDFAFLLNELAKSFTRFELSEFVNLESKYSKNLYRLLKQYRKTGTYQVEADKFRELMDSPKSYSNKVFMYECVGVAIRELSQGYFKDLKVEPITAHKRGAPIIAYSFSFKPTKDIPGQFNLDYYQDDEPKVQTRRTGKNPKNRFNNFHQREYDYDDMERKLLKGE